MTTVRSAKSKGSSFEYDTLYNLQKHFPATYLTSKQGFQQGYDLRNDTTRFVVECKRHKGFSWNELKKYYDKLVKNTPQNYHPYLVFKGNNQPPLVMFHDIVYKVCLFEDMFGVKFEKHPGIRSVN